MTRQLFRILLFIFASSTMSQTTELKLYRAYGENHPLIITEEQQGHCWQPSKLLTREDAWRCQTNHAIYDPCFISPFSDSSKAFCPDSPWDTKIVQINLPTKALAHSSKLDMSRAYPWAIKLAEGQTCLAITSSKKHDNQPIRYRCTNDIWLFGKLQRCKMPWRILALDQHQQVTTVILKEAWF